MKLKLNEAIEILEQSPKTLKMMLGNLSEPWIYKNEGENTWSPFDIVGHLCHGEKTDWIERIKRILEHGEKKAFEAFDRFAQLEDNINRPLFELLEEFENLRQANIEKLKNFKLSSSDFSKKGKHPALGQVSLENLLSTWVVHDLGHIAQISRVMAKQYSENVGPWKNYLPILEQ